MAKQRYTDAVPEWVRNVAQLHGMRPPDWYVGSAEATWSAASVPAEAGAEGNVDEAKSGKEPAQPAD